MIRVLHRHDGLTSTHERGAEFLESWIERARPGVVWIDLSAPGPDEARVLSGTLRIHDLTIEDVLASSHSPKLEAYEGYFYLILHGIDFQRLETGFATHDIDFIVGPDFLITVHDGRTPSVADMHARYRTAAAELLDDGPLSLAHRIIDTMVELYRPEVDKLAEQLDDVEDRVFEHSDPELMRALVSLRRDVASLRRVVLPQRDIIRRLARREFPEVSETLGYRFRDVHDQFVRLTEDTVFFQERVASLLEAHLAGISNQLGEVMKVLTLIATIFMPLTVLTGLYGMNVVLPKLPGGPEAQFAWVIGMLLVMSGGMLWFFRTRKWL